jgi:low temperature requirement protein LtrA
LTESTDTPVELAEISVPGDRSVKPFELFFDLVFVFAFTQVTQLLASDLSWNGLGQGVLLIAALWLAWQSYAWLGTAIDLDEGAIRLAMLSVMGGLLVAALAVPGAFDDTAVLFAAAYAFVRFFQLVLFLIAARNIDGLLRGVLLLARGALVGPTLILIGAISGWGPLEAWWAGALLLEYGWYLVMDVSGFRLSPHHFSERHGLIFIIVLGEAVISIGIGASGLKIDSTVVVPALLGLGIIVAMWWTYFDVNVHAAERHLKSLSGAIQIRLAQRAYTFSHLPMIVGGIFLSLGVKKTLAHTDEVLATIPAVALCGGLVLYLIGQMTLRATCGGFVAWPRLVAILALWSLIGVSQEIEALILLSAVSLVFALLVAYETLVERHYRHRIRSDETAMWSNRVAAVTEE